VAPPREFRFWIVLPGSASLYAPAAGAATTALLWWMFGRRDVPVGALFLAGFFGVLATIGLFVLM
jgi:hypothetical protein